MTPALNSSIWNLCSSILPAWYGRLASRACSSLKPCAAKVAYCAIILAIASWRSTIQSAWSSPPAMLLLAPSIPKYVKAAAPSMEARILDISQKPAEYVKRKLPSMYHQFLELADVDITKGPMEVGPTCHYMMGGIRVEAETAATTVPGLFAAGEVAAGLHGANRLGGNSLSDLLVFGRRAGQAAAENAMKESFASLDATDRRGRTRSSRPFRAQHQRESVHASRRPAANDAKPGRNFSH